MQTRKEQRQATRQISQMCWLEAERLLCNRRCESRTDQELHERTRVGCEEKGGERCGQGRSCVWTGKGTAERREVCVAVCCTSEEHIMIGARSDRRDQLYKLRESFAGGILYSVIFTRIEQTSIKGRIFIAFSHVTAARKRSSQRAQPKEMITSKTGQGSFAALSHG